MSILVNQKRYQNSVKFFKFKIKGILEIKDVEYNVVKEMLRFIYCGKSSGELSEIASDLLIAADKYRFLIFNFIPFNFKL